MKNYRTISLLPICGKSFEKIIFNNLYSNANNLIPQNHSGFRPGDSTSNQLLYLANEIDKAFDDPKSLEVRAVFLDVSKFLPVRTLDQIYNALVRSYLDYSDFLYHIPSIIHQPTLGMTVNSLMKKVERIQYQAALAITGASQGTSRSRIYGELG